MKEQIVGLIGLFCFVGSSSVFAATGTVVIKGTSTGSMITGTVNLEDTSEGLKINVAVENVPPGRHGFHIHENGDCAEEGKAAGGHYNPDQMPHGIVSKEGVGHVHPGDLGNITIDENGMGKLEAVVPGLTLIGGKYNVGGRSFILHEKEDDLGQPTGNAGGRIACGVINAEKVYLKVD